MVWRMRILGIETSCDETAAAVVDGAAPRGARLLSHRLLSQTAEHAAYGGVVPEIAARAHLEHLDAAVARALDEAGTTLADLDGIAATAGPGLIGGVLVGATMGKALASVSGKPFVAVNHLEGHALTARLTDDVPFPYLLLLVSGGHTQFVAVEEVGRYTRLGTTIDDALGEAFDKTAKMLGLLYPGGPAVEKLARLGDPARFDFPLPLKGREGCDFSFSGIKTAIRREVERLRRNHPLTEQDKADVCASFQRCAGEIVRDRAGNAIAELRRRFPAAAHWVIAGGVAANRQLHEALASLATDTGLQLVVPPPALCTDNAAMIAWAGVERLQRGMISPMDFEPRARWPLGDGE